MLQPIACPKNGSKPRPAGNDECFGFSVGCQVPTKSMRPRSNYTEITVMAGPRRGEGPDLPTPPEPGVGGGNVEVTVVAGPDFLPTRVVPADQGTVRAETTEPQDSGEPPCPPISICSA